MFERTESEKRKLSSKTTPIWCRNDGSDTWRRSWPSTDTDPSFGS